MHRGTQTIKDAFTNLTGASKPHHVLNERGLVLGYCHFGMLAAARWIHREVRVTGHTRDTHMAT